MAGERSEVRESTKSTVGGTLAGWLMRFWCATLRFEIEDRSGVLESEGPLIYSLWHNRIFVVPAAWKKWSAGRRRAVVLTSASHDGAMLARAVGVFGIGAARGSSSRRGVGALLALRKALREGCDCCLTPDGPRGPRFVLQSGLVKLAEREGVPVVPIHVKFSGAWRLKTWDRFLIPFPFSRVRVIFDRALAVPGGLSDGEFERLRARIEEVMRAGADEVNEHTSEKT